MFPNIDFAFIVALFLRSCPASTTPTSRYLNVTTIATNAQKQSTLECWQLDAPLITSLAQGTVGAAFVQLGEAGAVSWGFIPAKFDGGLHNAPVVQ